MPQTTDWQYLAPHRAANPIGSWSEAQQLNLQRLARLLEFRTLIAFAGVGCSWYLGYPVWNKLFTASPAGTLPVTLSFADWIKCYLPHTKAAELLTDDALKSSDLPALYQLLEDRLAADLEKAGAEPIRQLDDKWAKAFGGSHRIATPRDAARAALVLYINDRFKKPPTNGNNPYLVLREWPLRRFLTTNYDIEIEKALIEKHGQYWDDYQDQKVFCQDQAHKVALFGVPLARENQNNVFHCHGVLPSGGPGNPHHTMVLTEADYKRWYLDESNAAFQDAFAVVLQSNPLLIVGYRLGDPDIVRFFRQLSTASPDWARNVIFLARQEDYQDVGQLEHVIETKFLTEQARLGISIIAWASRSEQDNSQIPMSRHLETLGNDWKERRRSWRDQPMGRRLSPNLTYELIKSSPSDPLFPESEAAARGDVLLETLVERLKSRHVFTLLCGPFGSGKYVKLCQLRNVLNTAEPAIEYRIFSAHGNEDVYTYLRRIVVSLRHLPGGGRRQFESEEPQSAGDVVDQLREILLNPEHRNLVVAISGVERFFDLPARRPRSSDDKAEAARPNGRYYGAGSNISVSARQSYHDIAVDPKPRNRLAFKFRDLISEIIAPEAEKLPVQVRLIITSRVLFNPIQDTDVIWTDGRGDEAARSVFTMAETGLVNKHYYQKLLAELLEQQGGLLIASAFINAAHTPEEQRARFEQMLHEIQMAPGERGTRVVRCVIQHLDAKLKHAYEMLLRRLSCFNRPFDRVVWEECWADLRARNDDVDLDRDEMRIGLKQYLLLHQLRDSGDDDKALYIIPPLVKRYCRSVLAHRGQVEGRAFGLHGYGSRGPFEDPGKDVELVRGLFDRFEKRSRQEIGVFQGARRSKAETRQLRRLVRAAFEIIRGNFACNSSARWGSFADYLDMCIRSYDLAKNYAAIVGDVWAPGELQEDETIRAHDKSDVAALTAEEVLWILNEIGLAYYATGNVQDAISIWGLALDRQQAMMASDRAQSTMYAASLRCHLGMGFLYIGRLKDAQDYFTMALRDAVESQNIDLGARLRGFLGRVANLKGDLTVAENYYNQAIADLVVIRNHRAHSYFLRFQARLRARLGDFVKAEELVRLSLNIAASENYPDVAAYGQAVLAHIYAAPHNPKKDTGRAMSEYRVALKTAQRHSMRILESEVLLGMAKVQLDLKDASSAKHRAFRALKLANEGLLVLRQVEALTIIGRAYFELGDTQLGVDYLNSAATLAASCEYRLHQRDAEMQLASLTSSSR